MKLIKKSLSLFLVLAMIFSTFSGFAVGENGEIPLSEIANETLFDTQIPRTADYSGDSTLDSLNSLQNRAIVKDALTVTSMSFSQAEDAYIDSSQPDLTTGGAATLLVGSEKTAYLKYDMSLLPEGAIVTNATISAYRIIKSIPILQSLRLTELRKSGTMIL